MDNELDYIITSYASLKLSSSSPLKDISLNSPSKLRLSPQKQSSKIIKSSPLEIYKLCSNVITMGLTKITSIRSLDSSYLRLISSCFFQLYKVHTPDQESEIFKKHQLYIVKLIELETNIRSDFSFTLAEIRSAHLKQSFKDSSNPLDILVSNASIILKFLILQVVFKRFQMNNFEYSDNVLNFLLKDSLFIDQLSKNQKVSLVKLVLSLAKSSISPQFKQCMNLKFLQYLIQFEMIFEDYIYNIKKEKFIKDVQAKLVSFEEYEEVPFFLFDYGMVDTSQHLLQAIELYQKSLSAYPRYQLIHWSLVIPDPDTSNKFLKLLAMPNINNLLLQDQLDQIGRPNATIIEKLGEYILESLPCPDFELQPIITFYLTHIDSPNKSILNVLDKFVIHSARFIQYPTFIEKSFLLLEQYFKKMKSYKRLKNISNLFYNYASKVSKGEHRVLFMTHSLMIEAQIFKLDYDASDLSLKFEKSIRFLLGERLDTKGAYSAVFNDDIFKCLKGSNIVQKFEEASLLFGFKILFSALFTIPLKDLSQENKTIIFCLASKFSSDDLQSFFNKLQVTDAILQMLCGVFYEGLPLVKSPTSKQPQLLFQPQASQIDPLVKTFYYLTQEVRTKSTSNLKKIVQLYSNGWLPKSKTYLSTIEFMFLKKLVNYLKFNGFLRMLKKVLTDIDRYRSFENHKFNEWLDQEVLKSKLQNKDHLHLSETMFKVIHPDEYLGFDGLVKYLDIQLLKVEFYLVHFDRLKLLDLGNEISQVLESNSDILNIENKKGYAKGKFLTLVLLLIKLHFASAKVLSLLGKHLLSISSARLSVQLSKTILKSNDANIEIVSLVSSGLRSVIKTLIHLGIAKDAGFFVDELLKFNNSVARYKTIYAQNCYFLSYYFFVSSRDEQCAELKQKGDDTFHALRLIEGGEYVDNFRLIFFHTISELYLDSDISREDIRERLAAFFAFVEKEGEVYSNGWRQYYEYHFNTEMSLKNTTNPFIRTMDLAITARKLFINAQSSLKADPLFSTLEDSAMSIPSTSKSDTVINSPPSSKSKSKVLRNVKKSIVSLKQSNRIVLDLFGELNYLSNHHIDEIHKILSLDLLTLSSISNSYKNEFIHECYKLNDYSKHQHLFNEKEMIKVLSDSPKSMVNFNFQSIGSSAEDLNSFPEDILERLPSDWMVITIDICSFNGDLVISKFEHGQNFPSFLRLPLSRHSSRTVDEESFSFESSVVELKAIIEQSQATTSKDRTSSITTAEERREWHQERQEIDERLGALLEKIEYCWLGGFKGIFNQEKVSFEQKVAFKEKFLMIVRQNIPSRSQRNTSTVEIDDFVVELFLKLGDPSKLMSTELLEDLIYFVLDVLLFHGEENAYDEIDIDTIYVQIENLIKDYISLNPHPLKNKHTILVIGKECQSIPWESLPCLRNTSVTRMPSLSYLLKLYESNQRLLINKKNGGYLLNPSGDLVKTENRMKEKFVNVSESLNWKGIVGQKPTEEEFEELLEQSNVFVYVGHGGGEQFIRSTTLKKMEKIAPTLLLGCSSASLRDNKLLEPSGTVYSYLIGGCPMVVGMLWDVTDKDIDKFSESMLSKWGLFDDENGSGASVDICDAIRQSRDVCNLKYLNGAAPVVYGLPLSLI